MKIFDIPVKLSADVPTCTECGEHMVVVERAAVCARCGHQQRFPWPLEVIEDGSHWWITNV